MMQQSITSRKVQEIPPLYAYSHLTQFFLTIMNHIGLELSPNNAVLYSNRAAAYASKGDWENSLLDANSAVKNKPTWGKAYNRKVLALLNLHRYDEAVATCEEGLKHEPENESLKASLKEGLWKFSDEFRRAEFS